jgi:ribosomal protein S18 acetylase RimI-like enzyme
MGYVIADLPAADIDRLEGLWRELLDHHLAAAPHLSALGTARDPADSWRVRRAQYLRWLAVPQAAVLVARDADRLLGYAMIRAADAAGSWQWGDQVGTLETLVVSGSARGSGAGRELLDAARERIAEWGARVMTISVIAGNERAERFYRRRSSQRLLAHAHHAGQAAIITVSVCSGKWPDDPVGEIDQAVAEQAAVGDPPAVRGALQAVDVAGEHDGIGCRAGHSVPCVDIARCFGVIGVGKADLYVRDVVAAR